MINIIMSIRLFFVSLQIQSSSHRDIVKYQCCNCPLLLIVYNPLSEGLSGHIRYHIGIVMHLL